MRSRSRLLASSASGLAALVIATTAALIPAGPAQAVECDRPLEDIAAEVYGTAVDLSSYMDAELEWMCFQAALASVAWDAETRFPDQFTSAMFTDDGNRTLELGFADQAPAEIVAALDATGRPYRIVEGIGFTQTQWQSESEELVQRLRTILGPGSATWAPAGAGAGVFPGTDVAAFPALDLGIGAIRISVFVDDTDDGAAEFDSIASMVRLLALPVGYSAVAEPALVGGVTFGGP
jgi:hypothetical protein